MKRAKSYLIILILIVGIGACTPSNGAEPIEPEATIVVPPATATTVSEPTEVSIEAFKLTLDGRGAIMHESLDRLLVWTPSLEQVAQMEAELLVMLSNLEVDPFSSHSPILEHIDGYTRQHRGMAREGRNVIDTAYFCDVAVETLLESWYDVLDGGDCYFSTGYDPESGEFVWFVVNGDA